MVTDRLRLDDVIGKSGSSHIVLLSHLQLLYTSRTVHQETQNALWFIPVVCGTLAQRKIGAKEHLQESGGLYICACLLRGHT